MDADVVRVAVFLEIVEGKERDRGGVVPWVGVDIIDGTVSFEEVVQTVDPEAVVDKADGDPFADP